MVFKQIKFSFIIGIFLPITAFIISFVLGVYVFNHFPGNDYYGVVRFYFTTSIITILIIQYFVAKVIQKAGISQFLVFLIFLTATYFFTSYYLVEMYLNDIMDLLPARSHFELLVAYSYPFSSHIVQTIVLLVNTVMTFLICKTTTDR